MFLAIDILLLFSSDRDLSTSSLEFSTPNKDRLPMTKCSVIVSSVVTHPLNNRGPW